MGALGFLSIVFGISRNRLEKGYSGGLTLFQWDDIKVVELPADHVGYREHRTAVFL